MRVVLANRLFLVWLALSAITLGTVWMGLHDGSLALMPNALVTTSTIVIALVKTRIILREFMEVRHAPALLGRISDAWLLISAACLLGAYFAGLARSGG